jgi:hypothetical protein
VEDKYPDNLVNKTMKEDIDNALWNLENLIYHRIENYTSEDNVIHKKAVALILLGI